MAKRTDAESVSAGVVRMIKPAMNAVFPTHGNNTEKRRTESPQSQEVAKPAREIPEDTSATGREIQKNRDEEG
jgi:hypothetical protein